MEREKHAERQGRIKAVVNSVVSLMDYYEHVLRQKEWKTDSTLPQTIVEAKKLMIKQLRQMRYDKTEFFFVLDGNGNVVLHPLKPELEGSNLLNIQDKNGEYPFKKIVMQSQRDFETTVSYVWESKYNSVIFEPQIVYAKYFWSWDWIVCSGVFTQDIEDSVKNVIYFASFYVLLTSVTVSIMLLLFVYLYFKIPFIKLLQGMKEVKKGNLDHKVILPFEDELGYFANQFNIMVEYRKEAERKINDFNLSLDKKVKERTSELQKLLSYNANLMKALEVKMIETERDKKEIEKLAESRKKLSMIGQMVAGIVHDIKNPIASVKALSEMANSSEIGREMRMEYLELIFREAERLNDMAYEILDFSKGELLLDLSDVSLKEFIDEIFTFLKIDFEHLGINLLIDLHFDGVISVDSNRLRRVIINLAKNAMEVMNDGKTGYYFKVNSVRQDNQFILSLADNGPGIPISLEEKIFEAFATEGKIYGTGLGLFMSKWIIEAHKGELKYKTKKGEGTTFSIFLPLNSGE